MDEKRIAFLLIQIEEAHTPAWPTGTITLGIPHTDQADRRSRAAAFAASIADAKHFKVVVDPWTNTFANRFRAWPDKYYLLDADNKVQQKSTYGATQDAVIDIDCVDLLYLL